MLMKWGGSKSMLYFGVVGRSVTVLGLVLVGLVGRPIWEHLPVAYPSPVYRAASSITAYFLLTRTASVGQ